MAGFRHDHGELRILIAAEWFPFTGLDPVLTVLFLIAFTIVVAMFAWTAVLFFRGMRSDRRAGREGVNPDAFEWIFMVPALNEEVTIADSVVRLQEIQLARKRIVVINDGSDDGTGEILAGIDDPDLTLIERTAPNARQGKAAALNYAFAEIVDRFDPDPDRTIICVVDADGRIDPDSPRFVAEQFLDERVGGVQALVRIYNRHRLLTWFQDIEFSVYGRLFQAGRNGWGTAGMGGNGQYNRLSALLSIDDRKRDEAIPAEVEGDPDPEPEVSLSPPSTGPWRDRLTEDQDLGLRLVIAGWECRHDNRVTVEQQGLPGLRRLFRQRTRWSQGNLQAMGLLGPMVSSRLYLPARIEQVVYLLMPVLQAVIGAAFIASIVLFATGTAYVADPDSLLWIYLLYMLGFGGVLLGCIAARLQDRNPVLGLIKGVLTAQVYALYAWLLWPVLLRSTFRQLTNRETWAKTAREEIATEIPVSASDE